VPTVSPAEQTIIASAALAINRRFRYFLNVPSIDFFAVGHINVTKPTLPGDIKRRGVFAAAHVGNVLPDALVVDLGSDPSSVGIVEAVATDGRVSEDRRRLLRDWAAQKNTKAKQLLVPDGIPQAERGTAGNRRLAGGEYGL